MRKTMILWAIMAMAAVPLFSQELTPAVTDVVLHDGKAFTGQAEFKFLIHSDSTVLWSNDGSCHKLAEPVNPVSLNVIDGIYSVELGSKPMKPLFADLLSDYPNPIVCTWVKTGNDFVLLSEMPVGKISTEEEASTTLPKPIPQLGHAQISKPGVEKEGKKEPINPGGWQKQWRKQHENEKGEVPMDGLVKAMRHIAAMPRAKDAGLTSWEWLGPGNIGGRIRAIAIKPNNPDVIFIGSVAGGLWKSTDAGSSWTVVNDFLPNLAITSIVYDPSNLNIMYAATGEGFNNIDAIPGAGIFKSVNGGSTWSQLASTNNDDFLCVNRLDHHPDSTGILYAATSKGSGSIWKTTDGGLNWNEVLTSVWGFLDVKISPHSPYNLLMAGTQGMPDSPGSGDLWLSSDWGKTWEVQSTGFPSKLPLGTRRCEVSFCPSNSAKLYVSIGLNKGEIWRSTDSGSTWTQMCTGYEYLKNQAWYSHCIWVDPTNGNRLIVGGIDLWRSTDGGATLTKISRWQDYHNNGAANSAHADQHIIVNHPNFNGGSNKTIFVGNDGGIQKAEDFLTVSENEGWTNLAGTTLGITQFYGGAASPDGSVISGGSQDNDQLRYRASGPWSGAQNWFQSQTGDGGFTAIDFNNSSVQYSEYTHLVITKSTDGGETWVPKIAGLDDADDDNNSLFIAPFVMDPNNSSILVAGGSSIWRTIDGAENWVSIRPAAGTRCSAIDIAVGNSNIVWVGYESGQLVVTNNATNASPTWTRVDNLATPLPDRYITDIAINPNNAAEVFVTFSGYYADNVWFTPDGGTTWLNRSGSGAYSLPELQVNTVRFHPHNSNYVYIGTDIGIFASEDQGLNWGVDPRYPSQNNELPANVAVFELFWQGDTHLIAATHGRGMYRASPLSVIYVDKLAAAGGNGSQQAPFNNVTDAVNAALPNTIISIKSNTYPEPPVTFSKKGRVKSTNGASRIK